MSSPFISIIVPIYKVEPFLQECIDSILAQTFTDFELILVDDGSPDNSGSICDQAAARDSRIRVIHQTNQGVTRARANGVAAAMGDFICFVDGDDTIPPLSLATLAKHATSETDIILGKSKDTKCPAEGELTAVQYREEYIIHRNVYPAPWAKLFRRALFTEEVFSATADIILGEDDIMNFLIAHKVQGKVYSTCTDVYNYRENPHSVTHSLPPLGECIKAELYKLKNIPEEDLNNFLPRGLASTLINYWLYCSARRIIIPESTRKYHRYLCSIRKHSDIRFGPFRYILFTCTNPLVRAITIAIYRILNIIRGIFQKPSVSR